MPWKDRSAQVGRRDAAVRLLSAAGRHAIESLERRVLLAAHVVGSATVYPTIQAAVNAAPAGGTVTVDAGSYAEQVTVPKTLTILGAQAGVDARLTSRVYGPAAAESIVTGAVSGTTHSCAFYVTASDVTLDGFTVQGETSSDLTTGAGIVLAPGVHGTHVLDNVIQNNVSGLFLANNSTTDAALIQHNLFRANNNNGINGGRGIYSDGSISGGNLTNVAIDANTFVRNLGGSGTTGLESAIAFEATVANAQSNIRVTNNVMDYNGKAVLFFNATNVLIQGNEVTNTQDQYSGTLRFEGNVTNTTIRYNTVFDNTGPAVAVDSKGVPGDNSGFTVTNNNFFGNSTAYGTHLSVIVNATTYVGAFDARNNWWGNASGPGGNGPGTGDTLYGNGVFASGSSWTPQAGGNALFSPWSTAPNGSGQTPYWGAPAVAAGTAIQAEDFDHGGAGVAYFNNHTGNYGGSYRPNESIDIEPTTDTGGGYDVGWTTAGEWMNYTVNLAQGGTYNVAFRVATAQATGGTFHLNVDGQNVTGAIRAPATGGFQNWQTVTVSGIQIAAGQHALRLVLDSNGSGGNVCNFNWIQLTPISVAPAAAAPTNLTAAATSGTSVNLAWQESSTGVTGFVVQRGIDGVNFTTVASAAAGATTFTDTTVAAGTTYYYRVYATNAAGNSPFSAAAPVATPAIVTAPSGLSAVAVSPTQVNLSWTDTAAGVETGFLVLRSADGVNFVQIGSTAAGVTTYADATVAGGASYAYVIVATSAGGNSPNSNVSTATTPAAGSLTTSLSDLNWASATSGFGTVQKNLSIGGNAITLHGITYPKGLGVHAVSQIVYNLNGNYTNFISDLGIDAEEYAKGTGSVDFQVQGDGRALFDSGVLTNASPIVSVNVNVSGVQTLTLIATNGVAGIDYDHADWAGARLLASGTLPPAAPSGLAATAVSATEIDLAWVNNAPAATVTGFQVQRSTDGVNFTPVGTTAATVTTYSDTGVAAGTTYTYRVVATNANGSSAPSNGVAATTFAATATVLNLSDLPWVSAAAGFGTVQKDASIKGNPITLRRTAYARGLGTHANSTIVYNLAGNYANFLADVGVDDETGGQGAVDFQVIGDGKVLYDSGVLTGTSAVVHVNVPVAGVQQLTLAANAGVAGTIDGDHADWAGARLVAAAIPPAAPSGLTATAVSTGQVNLTWVNNALTASGFLVQRSTDGVNFAPAGTTAANVTTFSDTGLAAGTAYTYRVLATNANGNSAPSNTASATTLSASAVSFNLSDLNWVSATAGYGTVQKNLSIAGNPISLHGVTYAKGLGTHAASTVTYALNGNYTNFLSDIGIDGEVYAKGTGSVDFQVVGDGKVLFDSGILTNASPTVSVNVNVSGVQTLALVANNGVAGIDYDHADWAGAKLLASGTLPPAAPSGLTAAVASTSQINLSWVNNAATVTGFQIQRSTDGVNFTPAGTTAANVTTYSDTGLAAGTAYTYRVVATNANGSSAPSNTVGATTISSSATFVNASDLPWASAVAGFGTVQKDTSIKGNPITLRGTVYAKGLGTHATSTVTYALNGNYSNFLSDAGIDDETGGQGSADFQVIGDGKVLYDSGILTGASPVAHVSVSLAGVQTLTLQVNPGAGGSVDYAHADWAGAQLVLNPGVPTVPAAPTSLAAVAAGPNQVNLTWKNNAANQAGFKIDRSTDGVNFTTVATAAATATTYSDTGVAAGTAYYYRVRATNAGGDSANSNVAVATTSAANTTLTYLSTIAPTTATTGYGTVQTDASMKGNPITLRGVTYAKGLGVHANSTIVYNLAGKYATFVSDVGIDDETGGQGSVDFQVIGDGKVLYDSGTLTGTSPAAHVSVSVAGVQQLSLVVTTTTPGVVDYDHADWANAALLA